MLRIFKTKLSPRYQKSAATRLFNKRERDVARQGLVADPIIQAIGRPEFKDD